MAYPIFQYMAYRVFGVVIQQHLWSKFGLCSLMLRQCRSNPALPPPHIPTPPLSPAFPTSPTNDFLSLYKKLI